MGSGPVGGGVPEPGWPRTASQEKNIVGHDASILAIHYALSPQDRESF